MKISIDKFLYDLRSRITAQCVYPLP